MIETDDFSKGVMAFMEAAPPSSPASELNSYIFTNCFEKTLDSIDSCLAGELTYRRKYSITEENGFHDD